MPRSAAWSICVDGIERPLCCAGCDAVAHAIVERGLSDYYRQRGELPAAPLPLPPEIDRLRAWDHPALQRGLVGDGEGGREASFLIENLRCAACVWLAEKTLARTPGVRSASVDFAAHRARVTWDPERIELSGVLAALAEIGLAAHPFDPGRARELLERERRDRLIRFLVAGALGMQVMTLAVAIYAGESSGMSIEFRDFFRWTSLVLTAPVLVFSGYPFFASAASELRHRRPGMDVPVSLGLLIAFFGSTWATVTGKGEIYFDSVVMFLFFLHGARLLENGARRRALAELERLARPVPAFARRLIGEGAAALEELVACVDLAAGDRIRVRPGEVLPCDGVVEAGRALVDEALLTGESLPVARGPGDRIVGGALNLDSPLEIRVGAVGPATVLAALERLVERARAGKPAIARLADRVAARFAAAVLLLSAAVALFWLIEDRSRALPIVIAVLVVSCPCALSLATPLALAAASGSMARRGLLITRETALEALAKVEVVLFDKTGTLTEGKFALAAVEPAAGVSREELLALAAGLERGSEHPLARALSEAAAGLEGGLAEVREIRNEPGRGVQGKLGSDPCALGSPAFVQDLLGAPLPQEITARISGGGTPVVVMRGDRAVGLLRFEDRIRPGARELIEELARMGIASEILSGDHRTAVSDVGAALGVSAVESEAKPERKLERVRELIASGRAVAMVGDGINDAAALSAASVSIAMGGGAFLAATSADAVLLSGRTGDLAFAFAHARRTLKVIRGNFVRALGYNAVILPLAAAGLVPPWAAALGMTASSAAVVWNASRLFRSARVPGPTGPDEALSPAGDLRPATA